MRSSNRDQQISKNRGKAYGNYDEMSETAQKLKEVLRQAHYGMMGECGAQLNHAEWEALDLICTKLARIANGDPRLQFDSWTDIIGYANLARESRPEPDNETD